jgi:ribonuclease HI
MKKVTIFTDGACSGNPGVGGWAAVLIYNEHRKEISGYEKETTNNRMELTAIIQGLHAVKEGWACEVSSDSQYVVDAFNKGWLDSWQKNNWRTAGKTPVKNVDLWQQLLIEVSRHQVEFVKVKGHADVELNERCDELARAAIVACNNQLS